MLLGTGIVNASFLNTPHKDFMTLTPDTYQQAWDYGKTIKKHGSLEHPSHYGLNMRDDFNSGNNVVLVTPYTATVYLSSTEELRLLQIPENFEQNILSNQNVLWIAVSWQPDSGFVDGTSKVKHLAIIKDGVKHFPEYKLSQELDELLPSIGWTTYFGFDRKLLLDAPYDIKYINSKGDIITVTVTPEQIDKMIAEEKEFKA